MLSTILLRIPVFNAKIFPNSLYWGIKKVLLLNKANCLCHQANKRIVAQVAHQLDMGMDRFLNNIEELGNTGSASAALVLAQDIEKIQKGEKVALMVFGGGYSCGCFIVEK